MQRVKNFPVGRVSFLYLYPLNFQEFLEAQNQQGAVEQLLQLPLQDFAHTHLLRLFHEYTIIGGMPEVVKTYLNSKSIADLAEIYEGIWATYKEDVEKYASSSSSVRVIKHLFQTAHLFVDQRIKFQNFGQSNYKSREVGEALRNLNDARIIQLIYPSTSLQVPIIPDHKKSPRLQFLDTGIVNHELNIQADLLALEDMSTAYKGAIIPHLITQELMSLNSKKFKQPNFWVREKAQSSAEVDLIVQYDNKIIPIEIKSGKEGKLKSLHQLIDKSDHPYAIRMYASEFAIDQHITPMGKKPYFLMNLPYYLGTRLPEYIAYFLAEYPR